MSELTMKIDKYNLPKQAQDLTHGHNRELTDLSHLDPNMIRKPDYHVYLFSVADRKFDVSRPTLNISRVTFAFNPNCLHDPEAYQFIMKVPSPYPLPYTDQNSGEVRLNTVVGERVAMDLVNPNQKSLDMDGYIPADAEWKIGLGDDLIAKGLFFISNRNGGLKFEDAEGNPCEEGATDKEGKVIARPVPPAEAVKKAVERKEKYYNLLLDKMKGYEYSSQADVDDFRRAEPDVHIACEYFGVETAWHAKRVQKLVKVECKLCGSEMVKGTKFHPLVGSKLGVCVSDWDAAIAAGVVSEEDRPKKAVKA